MYLVLLSKVHRITAVLRVFAVLSSFNKMFVPRLLARHLRRQAHCRMFSEAAPAAATTGAPKLTPPVPEGVEKPFNPKLDGIVNSIASLNLLEVSELSALLKKKLNLPETAFVPQMAAMPAAAADEDEDVPKTVQTSFKVNLVKFDEKQKVALIKEVKNLLEGMNLVQAKKFVESAPTTVKEDIPKEEAEKLKEALSKAGAIIEIV